MKIIIITGGWSAEREENLTAAKSVKQTLLKNGVSPLYLEVKKSTDFIPRLCRQKIDFALLCLTEEVPIQGILDVMNIPYNGSGVLTTALCLNKLKTKEIMKVHDVNYPSYFVLKKEGFPQFMRVLKKSKKQTIFGIKAPWVVKPNSCGSSIGITLVKKKLDLAKAIKMALDHSSTILVENYINGKELTIPVIGDTIFPPVEIQCPSGIYDEDAKANFGAKYKALVKFSSEMDLEIKKTISNLRTIFDLKNVWRMDGIWEKGKFYVLEVNTLPYLGGPFGVLATSFQAAGLTHYQFLKEVICESLTSNKS